MMQRIAIFPGSFDPITLGHVDIINRSLSLFDKVVIAIGVNSTKQNMFAVELREQWIFETFKGNNKIDVMPYEGLTIDFCKKIDAHYIIRGLRTSNDFEYEAAIARMNHAQMPNVETVCIICSPEFHAVSSSIIRDIIRNGGNIKNFVPDAVRIKP